LPPKHSIRSLTCGLRAIDVPDEELAAGVEAKANAARIDGTCVSATAGKTRIELGNLGIFADIQHKLKTTQHTHNKQQDN
jgi:hypothetical protein